MSKKGKAFQGAVGAFLRQYQRRSQDNCEPNDRQYDRGVEKKIKSMDPWLLNDIMHDDVGLRVPRDIDDRWFSGDRIVGVVFSLNDPVLVSSGPHEGKLGAVVSLTGLLPEPEYLVELGDGTADIRVPQSRLTAAPQE